MLPAQQLAAIQPHTEVGGAPIPLSEGLGAGLHQFLGEPRTIVRSGQCQEPAICLHRKFQPGARKPGGIGDQVFRHGQEQAVVEFRLPLLRETAR